MNTRVLKLATAMALVASIASVATASARYTGADYCAVQNAKGDWVLVGGASCNDNQGKSANADWNEALILDFDTLTVTDLMHPAESESFEDLHDMLSDLTDNHASEGWMYVANGKDADHLVYLMVNKASCAGNSDWYEAPACE